MVLEVAQFFVKPGSETAFCEAYRQGRHLLLEVEGCLSVRMTRGVESPSTFILLVEWDSVQTHETKFRGTERHRRWRELVGPHFGRPAEVEHFADVDA